MSKEIIYDSPDKARRCPIGFKSANNGYIMHLGEQRLKFNYKQYRFSYSEKRLSRLDKPLSLTELLTRGNP